MNINDVIPYLKTIASKEVVYDDPEFSAYDYSGGNYDDAFESGMLSGEVFFARELLLKLGISAGEEGQP